MCLYSRIHDKLIIDIDRNFRSEFPKDISLTMNKGVTEFSKDIMPCRTMLPYLTTDFSKLASFYY